MKNTIKITRNQLIEMLMNWNFGAQPASVQYKTSPKLNKEGNAKFGIVTKIANVGVMIGYIYENSVNNELEREGKTRDFMSQLLWNGKGKRVSLALSKHIEKGTFYLTYKYQQTFRSFHFDNALNFIPYVMLKPFFPEKSVSNQGVNEGREIHHRELAIENVVRLKFKKTTYEIVG